MGGAKDLSTVQGIRPVESKMEAGFGRIVKKRSTEVSVWEAAGRLHTFGGKVSLSHNKKREIERPRKSLRLNRQQGLS